MVKNIYKSLLLITLTLVFVNGSAQSDEAAIQQTILSMFEGMRTSDTALIRASFSPGAIMQTIGKTREGQTRVRTDAVDSFIVSIGRPHKEIYDERIVFETIRIDGDMAFAWTPYKFYLGEKFLHCGVNSFLLVKLDGKWKIQYIIDTRRRENCD